MTFGSVTTNWVPDPFSGSWYRLEDGVLMKAARLKDGSRSHDEVEIDFDRIGDVEKQQCRAIGERLAADSEK